MLGSLANAWKIPELRMRLLFTFAMLAAYRLGAYIPLPGVDPSVLGGGLQSSNPITGLFGTFTGGAFNNFSVFSLGIMPYITASIVMQLMTVAIPRLQELAKEGETGQQKITQYTRYFTLALALSVPAAAQVPKSSPAVDPSADRTTIEADVIRRHHPELLEREEPHPPGACAFLDGEGRHREHCCDTGLRLLRGRRRNGSAELLDPDHVACGVPDGEVSHAVVLLDRLLDDVGIAGLQPLEGAVEVLGGQVDAEVAALGHELEDRALLVVGEAGGGGRRVQDDGRVGLAGGADRDPPHPAVADVETDLEAEDVAVEGQRGVGVGLGQEAGVDGEVHGTDARTVVPPALLDS